MIWAVLGTDLACCTSHVDSDESVCAIGNVKKATVQIKCAERSAWEIHLPLLVIVARGAGSTTPELNSGLNASDT